MARRNHTRVGPREGWFAWRPVFTEFDGWVWLRFIYRRRFYLELPEQDSRTWWWIYGDQVEDYGDRLG
jgi:hypothetical protein